MKKLTTKEFIERSNKKHNNKYGYGHVNYQKAHSKVNIECPKHGLFEQKACDHLQGRGCEQCAIERRSDISRLDHCFVAEYFKKQQCILLDKYVSSKLPLKYVCKCGDESITTWNTFSKGTKCRKCGIEQASKNNKYTQEQVERVFIEAECKLLDRYESIYKPMRFICKCGRKWEKSFQTFRKSKQCPWCSGKAVRNIEEVRQIFESAECLLLDEGYKGVNQKLKFICKCGQQDTKTLNVILDTGIVRCKKCSGVAQPTQIEIEQLFKEAECKLLNTYVNCWTMLKFICKCGNEGSITLKSFKKGGRCKRCRKNKSSEKQRLDIEYIKLEFEKSGCLLLDNTYVNSYQRLKYICNCGRKAKINWQQFRSGKRCYVCGKDKNKVSGKDHYLWNHDRIYIETRKCISARCSSLIRRCLNLLGKKKDSRTESILGYSRQTLFNHITSHPNWNNVKDHRWHIDHILPVKAFVEHGITDLKIINAIDNLCPILAKDNFLKSDNYDKKEFMIYLKNKHINIKH